VEGGSQRREGRERCRDRDIGDTLMKRDDDETFFLGVKKEFQHFS